MNNLELYNKIRVVPKEARREIQAGRLRGKTDINPMWRLKVLTEQFGICGFGWKYVITRQWTEHGGNGEISAFVNIDLFIKVDGVWSEAIQGTGGSSFVANEKNGLYTSDECYKMALTDAISVACKALGMGADVYYDKDATKYTADDRIDDADLAVGLDEVNRAKNVTELERVWKNWLCYSKNKVFLAAVTKKKQTLLNPIFDKVKNCINEIELDCLFGENPQLQNDKTFISLVDNRRKELIKKAS